MADVEQLVDFVVETQKRVGDGPALIDAVVGLGMTTEQAEEVICTVRDAYFRAHMCSIGVRRQNVGGDYETDPLFQAALKRFVASSNREQSAPANPPPAKSKPWWRFW